MATHTQDNNNTSSESDALQWIYNEEVGAILHNGGCHECYDWKGHYQYCQELGQPSIVKARRAHRLAVRHSFESRVDSLEWEHDEMLQEVAALQQELEQVQMEIEEIQKDQVRIINSNLGTKALRRT